MRVYANHETWARGADPRQLHRREPRIQNGHAQKRDSAAPTGRATTRGDAVLGYVDAASSYSEQSPDHFSPAGYKFETLSTMPATWDETSRDFIESRENHVVNNREQYCSIVRTGIGKAILCLGGEVDASK